jgi:hypothetical protein
MESSIGTPIGITAPTNIRIIAKEKSRLIHILLSTTSKNILGTFSVMS